MKQGAAILLTFALACLCVESAARAQAPTPVGLWRQIDDQTGEAAAIVRIYRDDGMLNGRIVKLLGESQPGDPGPVCHQCEGALKDAPILGFPLINGMTKEGDEWTGGTILDPKTGKHYSATLSLSDDGQKLEVRGFIAIPLIGRTQTWTRVEGAALR